MSVLIKLDANGAPSMAEGHASAQAPTTQATARSPVGGRGDARLATYVKKPPPAGAPAAKDWREEGYVPLAEWLAGDHNGSPILAPTDDPHLLDGKLEGVSLIAIAFPKFADGRGLSLAVLLRKRLGYTGELRAVGDVARDQLFQMARCGLNAFALRADQDPADCLRAFSDYGDVYQDAADSVAPLFRRRDEANAKAQAWLANRKAGAQ
jgi:uncharacterized protein (DUF934 family)